MNLNRNLEAALEYARLGWPCFPLRPKDKRPLTRRGFLEATTDAEQLRTWWRDEPRAGVAIATGAQANLVVLDVDPGKGGADSLKALGDLPPTVRCSTGGGGQHFYFLHPGGEVRCTAGFLPGLDFRGDGGYVCAPFTLHPSGKRYRFAPELAPGKLPLAPIPAELLDRLNGARVPLSDADRVFPAGTRNDALTRLAGSMLRQGMSAPAILRALLEENEVRCIPPLEQSEVGRIVEGISRRYKASAPMGLPPESAAPRALILLDTSKLVSEEPEPTRWIMEGWLAQGDCALLVGPEGSGKSWMTLDIAVAGALGNPILQRFTPWKPLTVLIVDEENPADEVHRRLRRIAQAWDADSKLVGERVILSRPSQGFSFRVPGYVDALTELVQLRRPDLIVLDSVTALSDVKDDNKPLEVRRFFHDRLYPLRDICGSTILLVHHSNKLALAKDPQIIRTGGVRGADYAAAADAVLFLWPRLNREPDEPTGWRLACEKARRGVEPSDLLLRIVDNYPAGVRPIVEELPSNGGDGEYRRGPIEGAANAEVTANSVLEVLADRTSTWVDAPTLMAWVEMLTPGVKKRTFYRALEQLVGSGQLSKRLLKAKGSPTEYRLRPEPQIDTDLDR